MGTPKRLQSLINERHKNNLPELVLQEAYPVQRDFILDTSKRKAAFVLRRGGKSTAVALYLIYAAMTSPRTKSLYMAATKEAAENIMWLNIVEPILLKYNIPHQYNKSRKIITFQNKSTIQLTGADASDSQITKYLGGKYILAIFDECQDIKHDLKHWIEDMLGPAMVDYGGTICCIGTAGRSIGRYWYEITKPNSDIRSWAIHKWSAKDNPAMSELLEKEMARLKVENPNIEKTEGFRNQYLCEWVLDNTDRVYHSLDDNILKDETLITSLLNCDKKWFYMIGFDFGFEDDTAYVVGAFSKHDTNAYIVETFKKDKMVTEDLAVKLQELRDKYHPIYMVGDCQNKILVQTLRQQYRLPLREAEQRGKEAHIAAMNSDFTMNKIKIIKHMNEPLLLEWATLIWDEKKRLVGIFEEKASKDNHAADACLYLHHFSKHYRATPEPPPDPNPMMTAAENRVKRQQNLHNSEYIQDDEYNIYNQIEDIR